MDQARPPLIGVTGHRIETGTDVRTMNVAVKESYLHAVRLGGGIPIVLPPTDDPAEIDAMLDRVDGLLCTGGRDVDPAYYGETVLNETVHVEPYRDAFELPLTQQAVARDLPLLGICRGCQVLNVALGGTLYQDLAAQRPRSLVHQQLAPREAVSHEVRVRPDSLLGNVLADFARGPLQANSFHHQACKELPETLHLVARSSDDSIEGLEAPHRRFVLGVQWHPEDLAAARPEHRRLFEALVRAARSS